MMKFGFSADCAKALATSKNIKAQRREIIAPSFPCMYPWPPQRRIERLSRSGHSLGGGSSTSNASKNSSRLVNFTRGRPSGMPIAVSSLSISSHSS